MVSTEVGSADPIDFGAIGSVVVVVVVGKKHAIITGSTDLPRVFGTMAIIASRTQMGAIWKLHRKIIIY